MKGTSSDGEADQLPSVADISTGSGVADTQHVAPVLDVSALQRLGKPLQTTSAVFKHAANVVKVAPLNHLAVQDMLEDDDILVEVESNEEDEGECRLRSEKMTI